MKKYYIGLVLSYMLLCSEVLLCQTISFDPPQIIPPSPTTQSLTIFGNYPVSCNTGVPDISIPLYTIHSGNIEIPIVLRYHTANLKKDGSVHSNIAHGWILDVGGCVSRCINNKPDEVAPMAELAEGKVYDQYTDNEDQLTLSHMYKISQQMLDTEHDIFQYNFLGRSGGFLINRLSSSNLQVIMTPERPYKVGDFAFSNDVTFPIIKSLVITDDRGTRFLFGGERTEHATEWVDNADLPTATAWYLRRITEDNGNEILFNYSAPFHLGSSQIYRPNYKIREQPFYPTGVWTGDEIWGSEPWEGLQGNYHASWENDNSIGNRVDGDDYQIYTISSILFSQGQVIFTQQNGLVTDMEIRNVQNQLLRKVHFTTTVSSSYSNLLQQVSIFDTNNTEVEKYNFQYTNTMATGSYGLDYWGYINNSSATSYLPSKQFTLEEWQSSRNEYCGDGPSREPHDLYVLSDCLQKIIYPTGGSTEFEFESNKYSIAGEIVLNSPQSGGGLRIKSIINRGIDGSELAKKNYVYGNGSIGTQLNSVSNTTQISSLLSIMNNSDIVRERFRRVTPTWTSYVGLDGNIVHYTQVEEYNGDASGLIGRTKYTYSNPASYTYTTQYANASDVPWSLGYSNKEPNHLSSHAGTWLQPELLSTEIYNATGTLIKKTTYSYSHSISGEYLNMGLIKMLDYQDYTQMVDQNIQLERGFEVLNYLSYHNILPNIQNEIPPPLINYYYTINTGTSRLLEETTQEFRNGQNISTASQYEYANNYYPSKIMTTRSDGNIQIVENKYSCDLQDAVSLAMQGKNILAPLVEVKVKKQTGTTTEILSTLHRQYDLVGAGLYRPTTISASQYSDPLESRLTYHSYDAKGNLLDIAKTGDMHTVYLWSYNYQYPVAKIEGISYADLVHNYYSQSQIDQLAQTVSPTWSQIETIRTALANANVMITTYTYAPLIGMVTVTDPRGVVTKYTYDTFNRLLNVKDHDNNIMNEYHYHYYDQH